MVIRRRSTIITSDVVLLFLHISFVSICITKATATHTFSNDENNDHNRIKRADECRRILIDKKRKRKARELICINRCHDFVEY